MQFERFVVGGGDGKQHRLSTSLDAVRRAMKFEKLN
jgi:hypothetical protein